MFFPIRYFILISMKWNSLKILVLLPDLLK